ncbi:MAG TPA: DUF1579 family protein [Planctomycetota bacterium]|nr:DUF1579 family protein [Planctomycetota bacterium]
MHHFLGSLLLLLPAVCLAYAAFPEPQAKSACPASSQSALQPTTEHALLQARAGTWDAVIVLADPAGGEQRSAATLVTTKHADFHTLDEFRGTLMGMPFAGHGINGYCAVRKQFFTLWTDSTTPSPMLLYGDYDAKKRELVLRGECYGMSGKLEPCRSVTRLVDDDHASWTLFRSGSEGVEQQLLRIDYTRKR